MHILGNYVFDSKRLLFVQMDMYEEYLKKIDYYIHESDNFDDLAKQLLDFDENGMTAKNKQINQIGISLTYNCNLRCTYCSYSSETCNSDELTIDDIIAFVAEAIKQKKIYNTFRIEKDNKLRFFFTGGGEPTFNWPLFTSVILAVKQLCRKYGIEPYFELTTNGMINENQRKFVGDNFDKVMVSYDGTDFLQNKNRKCANLGSSSHMVEQTIEYLIKTETPVTIRTTVWQEDTKFMKEIYDNIIHKFPDVTEWSIMPILPVGRALKNIDEDEYEIKKGETFFDQFIDLIHYSKTLHPQIYISSPLFNNSIADYCCGATFNECYWIMPDKTINNCIEATEFKSDVGRIDNGKVNLYDYYRDFSLEQVRKDFLNCRNCIAYRFCKGGCPLKSMRDKKYKTNYKAYECNAVKQYWKYVLCQVSNGYECFGWRAEAVNFPENILKNVYRLVRDD